MKNHYFFFYLLIVLAQVLICEWFNLSAYVRLSILPVAVFCIPTRYGTIPAMFIAFATGLAVDFLAEGVPGLNTMALVPVALVRESLIRLIFGDEPIIRQDPVSIRKYGLGKMTFAIFLVQTLFLAIYLLADGALMRPVLFSLLRLAASDAAGVLVSVLLADLLTSEERR